MRKFQHTQSSGRSTPDYAQDVRSKELLPFRTAEQPQATKPASNRVPDAPLNVWELAYNDLEVEDPKLSAEFAAITEPHKALDAKASASKDVDWNKYPAATTIDRIEALQAQKATLHQKSAKFRKKFEETIKLVISAQDVISAAAESNPYAATAWTAISFILPLFLISSEENDAAMDGLNFAAVLIVEYRWKEKSYLSPDSSEDFVAAIRKLYKAILQYEATLYVHLNKNAAKRLARNLLHSGSWKDQLTTLEKLDAHCKKITNAIAESRSLGWKTEERKWQQEMLNQARHQEEKANLQKLYSRYEASKNINPLHVPGTLGWFLQHPTFLSWRASQSSGLLWLTHDPECGKSVLCKYLVDRQAEPVRSTNSPVVCYYFFRRESTEFTSVAVAVRALIHQLLVQRPHLYKYAALDFEEKGERFLDDLDTLWQIFVAAINDEQLEETICVIDGLDDCKEITERKKLVAGLIDLVNQFNHDDDRIIKVFVTSRPYLELESEFRTLTDEIPDIRLAGEKELDRMAQDIDLVQEHMIQKLTKKRRLPPATKRALSQYLSTVSNRTYLWLTLTFDFLEGQTEIDRKTIPKLLEEVPNTVDDAYTKILEGVKDPHRARRLLQYVLAAAVPLSVKELNILMHLDEKYTRADEVQLWPDGEAESTIRNICGLFVSVVDDRVYLIHSKARDFLEPPKVATPGTAKLAPSDWRHTFNQAQSQCMLAEACVNYLTFEDFEKEPGLNSFRMKHSVGLSLFTYAATHWPSHFSQAQHLVSDGLNARVAETLYGLKRHVFELWAEQYRVQCSPKYRPNKGTRLMWAAFLAQAKIVKRLLEVDSDVDHLDTHGRSALFFAAYSGCEETVQLLLDHGAKATIKDLLWQTPLHVAMQKKHLQVTKTITTTTQVNMDYDVLGFTPMQYGGPGAEALIGESLQIGENNEGPKAATINETEPELNEAPTLAQLLEQIRWCMTQQHDNGRWKSISDAQLLVNTASQRSSGLGSGYDALREAIYALEEGEKMYEEARRQVITAFDRLDIIAHSESPLLLLYVPRTAVFIWTRGYYRLLEAFGGVLTRKIRAFRGDTHPLTSIFVTFDRLLHNPELDFAPTLDAIMQCIIDQWTQILSPHHYQVIYAWHVYWLVKGWLDGPASVSSRLLSVSQSMDDKPGRSSIQAVQLKVDVAQNQLDGAAYQDAENSGKEASSRVLEAPRDRILSDLRMIHLLCEGLRVAAEAATKLDQMDQAEAHFRKSLETVALFLGPQHVRSKEMRRRFGRWLRARGRLAEARAIETWR